MTISAKDKLFSAFYPYAKELAGDDEAKLSELISKFREWAGTKRHFFSPEQVVDGQPRDACAVISTGTYTDYRPTYVIFEKMHQTGLVSIHQIQWSDNEAKADIEGYYSDPFYRQRAVRYCDDNDASQAYSGFSQADVTKHSRAFAQKDVNDFVQTIDHLRKHFRHSQTRNGQTFVEAAFRYERQAIHRVLIDFARALDQDALSIMSKNTLRSLDDYHWLAGISARGSSSKIPPETRRQRRLAFAQKYPFIVPLIEKHFSSIPSYARTSAVIDKGDEFLSGYLDHLNTIYFQNNGGTADKRIFKYLENRTIPELGVKHHKSPHSPLAGIISSFGVLSSIQLSWWPRTGNHWQKALSFSKCVIEWHEITGRSLRDIAKDLLSCAKECPELGLPLRGKKSAPDYICELLNKYDYREALSYDHNVKDSLEAAAKQICVPYIAQQAAQLGYRWDPNVNDKDQFYPFSDKYRNEGLKVFLNGVSIPRILRSNQKWHQHHQRLAVRTSASNEQKYEKEWAELFAPFTAPSGLHLRCLTSTQELEQHGKEQDHCVGGYTHSCYYDDLHVVVLTDPASNEQTTLGFFLKEANKPEHYQHTASGNNPISSRARQTEEWLFEVLKNKRITINQNRIATFKERCDEEIRKNRYEELLIRTGFDPMATVAAEEAFRVWVHTVPNLFPGVKRLDHMPTRDAYMERIGMDKYVAKLVQDYKDSPAP